ncbi:MAG: glutamyl-tRNA reductase [Eubacteriales bacterium]|nr:glutamyl-tRNA reductase [Eubacteriales bacterium]
MIQMMGTSHKIAPVKIRSRFTLDRDEQKELLERLTEIEEITGAVILSTCNRMEVWVSTNAEQPIPLRKEVFRILKAEEERYLPFFSERLEETAIRHLFYLASGLRSAILAEDQILAQVKDSLEFSRECGYTDSCLEVLFRTAVTAAKEVKTKVHFSHVNSNAVEKAVSMLKAQGFDFHGKKCLVIGNGKYGKLAASTLRRQGADVAVTVRFYQHGSNTVQVPDGCRMVNYLDRMQYLQNSELIISATTSPHYTVDYEDVRKLSLPGKPVLLDLAVPHDVDPKVAGLNLFQYYDIDAFVSDENDLNADAYEKAKEIIDAGMAEFRSWAKSRERVPYIANICSYAVEDLNLRIRKGINRLDIPEEDRQMLFGQIDTAVGKVLSKMLFELQAYVADDAYGDVVSGLKKVYQDE